LLKKRNWRDYADRELAESAAEARRTRSAGLALDVAEESDLTLAQQRTKAKNVEAGGGRNLAAMTIEELQRVAASDAKLVAELAAKSKNLKGTFQRALKNVALSLQGIVTTLASRQQSEEILRLEAENKRLKGEMEGLRTEMAEMREFLGTLRRETRRLPSTSPPPLPRTMEKSTGDEAVFVPPRPPSRRRDTAMLSEVTRNEDDERMERVVSRVMTQLGVIIAAGFEAIEERLFPEKKESLSQIWW